MTLSGLNLLLHSLLDRKKQVHCFLYLIEVWTTLILIFRFLLNFVPGTTEAWVTDHRLPIIEGDLERAEKRGKTWAGGEGEIMDGLCGRGCSAIWHHGGLEHCRT